MRPTRSLARLLLFLCLAPARPTFARATEHRSAAPGVELVQTILTAADDGGPELIHELIVDPSHGARLEAAMGNDTVEEGPQSRENLNLEVVRKGAVAGVNGDFFDYAGEPLGLHIHGGEMAALPYEGRAAFGIGNDGKPRIGVPSWSAAILAADGTSLRVAGLNRRVGKDELVVLSSAFGPLTPAAPATLVFLDTRGARPSAGATLKGRVQRLFDAVRGIPIPSGFTVLAATGTAADWLKTHAAVGQTMETSFHVDEPGQDWAGVKEAVGGGPLLLKDGSITLNLKAEHISEDFSTTRHPRTAVGITADGKILLVAVDGRQALSKGMSLAELAATMRALGAVDALNLDGGGSTTLSVYGLVVNSPSDGQVRGVADSLLVYLPDAVPQPLGGAYGNDAAHPAQVVSGGPPAPALAADSPVAHALVWGTENGGAFVDQEGRIYGYRPGRAEVMSRSDSGGVVHYFVDVLPGAAGKILTAWKDGTLVVTVRDANNNPVAGQEVTLKQPGGKTIEVTTGADGKATAPKGWLASETAPASLLTGVLQAEWPAKTGGR